MKEKLEEIKKILKGEYGDRLTETELNTLAGELYHSLFVGKYELEDLVATIVGFESEADTDDIDWVYLFNSLVDLLDDNENTAERLYISFMHEFDLLDTFLKLYEFNAEYISAEKLAEAKEKALHTFSKDVLAAYGITEEDD